MYLREVHAESSLITLRHLILSHPLGVLTTAIPHPRHPLLQSSHVPFVLDVSDPTSETEKGVLRGHLARVNPQAQALMHHLATHPSAANEVDTEVLVLFTSPVQHYVTPKFYVATKPATGKVVPTWNYAAVQAYGRARIYPDGRDPDTRAFLARQIDDLSRYAEEEIMGFDGEDGRQGAWKVADAPERYVELLSKAIIGVEIKIDRLEGKWKMSQETKGEDWKGTVEGFEALGSREGDRMAESIRQRGELRDQAKKAAE